MTLIKTLARRILISDLVGNSIRLFTDSVKLYQLRFVVSSKYIRGKVVSLLFFQKYEKEEVEMIQKYLRTDLPILDLGSSLGIVATTAASCTKQSIVCVEANQSLVPVIEENLKRNGISESRYTIVNAAITDSANEGATLFFETRGSNELGRLCAEDTPGAVKVNAVTLSTIVKNAATAEYILISDIEGAEAAFLYSDVACLQSCKQLFIELHPITWNGQQLTIDDLVKRIESLGFVMIDQRGANFYFTKDAA